MEHSHPKLVCALLPQIPNVKISVVEVTGGGRKLKEDKYTKYMQMIETSRGHESTCLMLFCNSDGHRVGSHMASLARLR